MKLNYFVIALIAVLTSTVGGWVTASNMDWYATIRIPAWTPPGSTIGSVWTLIYILTAISAMIVWNRLPRDSVFQALIGLYILNAVLNAGWSGIFFGLHRLGLAVFAALALEATVLAIMGLAWGRSRTAALLLAPYAAWVLFASYLTYTVWCLNRA